MSRILVTAAGYWGDVLPFVSVARELAARGHHVDVVVPSGFHDALADEPVELHRLGVDFSPRELFGVHRDIWDRYGTRLGGARAARWMIRYGLVAHLTPVYESIAAAGEHADAVLTHNVIVPARWVAETRKIPWVTMHIAPTLIPSQQRLPELRPVNLPRPVVRTLSRPVWATSLAAMERLIGGQADLDHARRRLGLPRERHHLTRGMQSPHGLLLPVSPAWFPRPTDWPPHHLLTGFIPWEPPNAQLPADVAAYLNAGEPPVLVTLGTSAATNARAVFEHAATALAAVGVRGLFLVADPSNVTGALKDRAGVWPFVPLHLVLPRCRAVVHSASLGTTAAVLRAGLPSLAVPILFDQIWNAQRTAQLQAGLVIGRPTPSHIRSSIQMLVADDRLAQRAHTISAELEAEDGAARAADAVERALSRA